MSIYEMVVRRIGKPAYPAVSDTIKATLHAIGIDPNGLWENLEIIQVDKKEE
jgi:hypothetical protein